MLTVQNTRRRKIIIQRFRPLRWTAVVMTWRPSNVTLTNQSVCFSVTSLNDNVARSIDPRFRPFLLHFRCKRGGTFAWCFRDDLVNKISEEPLELGSWYHAYTLDAWFSSCDWLFIKFCQNLLELFPFSYLGIVTHKGHCEQNIWRTAWARVVIFGSQIMSKV